MFSSLRIVLLPLHTNQLTHYLLVKQQDGVTVFPLRCENWEDFWKTFQSNEIKIEQNKIYLVEKANCFVGK